MKLGLCIIILGIIIAICNPTITIQGATTGLNTWLFGLVPTLLPFIIISNFFLSKEITAQIKCVLPSALLKHYKTFCIALNIIAGFTFGLPVGAKITATLLENNFISPKEGQILLNHCNTIGPAFVGGFLLTKSLHRSEWLFITFAILYLPQLIGCFICLAKCKNQGTAAVSSQKIKISRLRNCFQILDTSIANGFETIVILGGYLILFGIVCAYIAHIPVIPHAGKAVIVALAEITSGTRELSLIPYPTIVKYSLCLPLTTFGGLCTMMQTKSIIKRCPLSIKKYFFHKVIYASISALIVSIGVLILY